MIDKLPSRKANVVVDTLRRKERLKMLVSSEELIKESKRFDFEIKIHVQANERVYEILLQPELIEKIRRYQERIMEEGGFQLTGGELQSSKDDKGIKRFSSRIWIINVAELKEEILNKAHNSR